MSRVEWKPKQLVMIGDRIDNDIAPAKARAWKTIRIKQGLSAGQVPMCPEQEPNFEARLLDDIQQILL